MLNVIIPEIPRTTIGKEAAAFYLRKAGEARRVAFATKGVLDRGAFGAAKVLIEFATIARLN